MELEKSAVIQLHSMSLDLSAAMLSGDKNGPSLGNYASADFSTFKAAKAFHLRGARAMCNEESHVSKEREDACSSEYGKADEENSNREPAHCIVSTGRERRRRAARLVSVGSEDAEEKEKEKWRGKLTAPDPPCFEGMGTGGQIRHRAEEKTDTSKHREIGARERVPDPPCGEDEDVEGHPMRNLERGWCALAPETSGLAEMPFSVDEVHVPNNQYQGSGSQKATLVKEMTSTGNRLLDKTPVTYNSCEAKIRKCITDEEVHCARSDNHPKDIQQVVHSSRRVSCRHHSDLPVGLLHQPGSGRPGAGRACAADFAPNEEPSGRSLEPPSKTDTENGLSGPAESRSEVASNWIMPPLLVRSASAKTTSISSTRSSRGVRPPWWRPTHAGILFKRGKVLKALLPRYFSLAGTVLTCHRDRDTHPSWSLDVSGAQLRVQIRRKRFIIETKDGRMLMLYGKCEDDVRAWITAIDTAADSDKHGKYTTNREKQENLSSEVLSSRGTSPTSSTSCDSELGCAVSKMSLRNSQTAHSQPYARGLSNHPKAGEYVTRVSKQDCEQKDSDLQAHSEKDPPRMADPDSARDSRDIFTDLRSLPKPMRPSGPLRKFAKKSSSTAQEKGPDYSGSPPGGRCSRFVSVSSVP